MNKPSTFILGTAIVAISWMGGYVLMREPGGTPSSIPPPPAADPGAVVAEPPEVDPVEIVNGIIGNLRSTDAAQHQKSLDDLAALPDDARNALRLRAAEVMDSEVKHLLQQRLAEIDERLALTPPPVSLHVKDATLAEVVAQLQGQMNVRFATSSLPPSESRFTLDADRLPFWEIIRRLSLQHPVNLGPGGIDQPLGFIDPTWVGGPERQQMLVQGAFMFYTQWLPPARGRGTTLPARDQRHRFRAVFSVDPRLTVLETQVSYEPLRDDLGHVLLTPPAPRPATGFNRFSAQHSRTAEMQLTTPDDAGARIPSWKINVRVVLALSSLELDIPDIQNHLNEPHQFGPTTVTATSFETDTQIIMRTESTSTSPEVTPYFVMELFDRDDKRVMHRSSAGSGGAGQSFGAGPPYRLHLTVPQKTKEVNLEFVIKDLVLPND